MKYHISHWIFLFAVLFGGVTVQFLAALEPALSDAPPSAPPRPAPIPVRQIADKAECGVATSFCATGAALRTWLARLG